jgi:hypothetical protein
MFTLQNIISKQIKGPDGAWVKAEPSLTVEQANAFMAIFAAGCRKKTKAALTRAVQDNFSHLRSYGLLERVYFDDDGIPCQFIARQDYHHDLTEVRDYIKKYY